MSVYLDYNATTPVLPEVLEAMLPFLRGEFGNPSSSHALGRHAHSAVETARGHVAALIGAQPEDIIFTSGGTEASNIAIRGALCDGTKRPIITSVLEHPATEEPCKLLAEQGHAVHRIGAHADGRIDLDAAIAAIRAGAGLVTLIHAQNETGVLQPIAGIAAAAHATGAHVHVDAAQSVGKIAVDVDALGADLLSIAGHKLYAPKGIGALYVRRGTPLQPVLRGAGQERGLRPGTENVASMVALGEACRLAALRLRDATHDMRPLAAALLDRLQRKVPGLALVGHPTERLPNTLNVLFPGVSGRAVLAACPDVMASTGSACHADREEASGVLRALGIAEKKALGAVRLSLGILTTAHEVEIAADALAQAWRAVARGHAPAPREVTTARP
jgi:cysteine desulfurase